MASAYAKVRTAAVLDRLVAGADSGHGTRRAREPAVLRQPPG